MRSVAKKAYHRLLSSMQDDWAVRLDHLLTHGSLPRLRTPRTFSEKIQHRKLYNRDPRFPVLADKIRVKAYVREALGEDWLIPTLWHGMSLPPRNERDWAIPYVLKAAHGSGQNIFVSSPQAQNWDFIEKRVSAWLRRGHASPFREWLYSQIPRRILVEPYIGSGEILPLDYKFYVFGGEVRFIQVDTARAQNHRRCFYDRGWNRQPFSLMYPMEKAPIAAPRSLPVMIEAAERLGRDFAFVRVDLYEVQERPFFGEMTFYPESGRGVFSPVSYDLLLGDLWPASYCYVPTRPETSGAAPALPPLGG